MSYNKLLRKKKTLIVVEAPFQLLTALEAIKYFNLNCTIYVRLNNNKVNDDQILNIISNCYYKKKIKTFLLRKYKLSLYFYFEIIKLVYLLFTELRDKDVIILGNIESLIFKLLNYFPREFLFIICDDGLKLLTCNHVNKFYPFFTFIPSQSFPYRKVYNYNFKFSEINFEVDINGSDFVGFIGDKFVDNEIVSYEEYILIIKKILHRLQLSNDKVIYFPHRGESYNNVKRVCQALRIKYLQLDMPLELVFNKLSNNILYYIGFFSTCLYTSTLIHPFYKNRNISVCPIQFIKKDTCRPVYKFLSENSVQVIYL